MIFSNNQDLIDYIIERGILKDPKILKAFLKMDRKYFLREDSYATYYDIPLQIGKGQTNSQPSTVAFMLELLDAKEGNKILDIGSGSGWSTALLCYIVGESGEVIGVERLKELVKFGKENLQKAKVGKNCSIIQAGSKLGLPEKKFDRILVSASANKFPEILIDQLKDNGIIVMPIGESIYKITKENNTIKKEEYPGFVFVSLHLDEF